MGQTNLEKIQNSIIDLQGKNQITPQQSKKFFGDYIASGEKIKDINKFMENPSIDLFLKHFINTQYAGVKNRFSEVSSNTNRQRKSFYNEVQEVSKAFKSKVKHKFRVSINDIKEINLNIRFTEMLLRQKFRNMLMSLLELQSFHLIRIDLKKKSAKVINSKILYFYELDSQQTKIPVFYEQSYRINSEQYLHSKVTLIRSIFGIKGAIEEQKFIVAPLMVQKNEKFIMIYELDNHKWKGQGLQIYDKFKKTFTVLTEKIVNGIKNIYIENQISSYQQMKRFSSKCILDILEMSLQIDYYRFKKETELIRQQNNLKNNITFERETYEFHSAHNDILQKIRAYKKQFCKSNIGYLNFDQYGFLTFIFTDQPEHSAMHYFIAFLNEKQQKIMKLFQNHKKVLKYVNSASNGIFKAKQIQIDESMIIRFFTDNKGRLSSISIIFNLQTSVHFRNTNSMIKKHLMIDQFNLSSQRSNKTGWMKTILNPQNINNNVKILLKKQTKKKINTYNDANGGIKNLLTFEDFKQEINFEEQGINLLQYQPKKLVKFTIKLFYELPVFGKFAHEHDEFQCFLNKLFDKYQQNKNSFHNFTHAANVMHTSYLFCISQKNKQILSDLQVFTIVFSALCHDVGHTGFTNSFEIASQSKIAIQFSYQSPLQNYHARQSFDILRNPTNNFLKALTNQEFRQFRKLFISNILSTDIKEHFDLMKRFQSEMMNSQTEKKQNSKLLANMIVHASDFAGSIKKFDICRAWSERVNAEFQKQYQQQKKLGLTCTTFMKDLNDIAVLAKNQTGFFKVIVKPLFKVLSNFYISDNRIQNMYENSENNMKKWQALAKSSLKNQKQGQKKQNLSTNKNQSKKKLMYKSKKAKMI